MDAPTLGTSTVALVCTEGCSELGIVLFLSCLAAFWCCFWKKSEKMSFLARSAGRGRVQPLVSGPWSELRIAEGSMVIGMGFLKT